MLCLGRSLELMVNICNEQQQIHNIITLIVRANTNVLKKSHKMFGELNIFSPAGGVLKYCRIPELNAAANHELSKEELEKKNSL